MGKIVLPLGDGWTISLYSIWELQIKTMLTSVYMRFGQIWASLARRMKSAVQVEARIYRVRSGAETSKSTTTIRKAWTLFYTSSVTCLLFFSHTKKEWFEKCPSPWDIGHKVGVNTQSKCKWGTPLFCLLGDKGKGVFVNYLTTLIAAKG